MAKKAVSKKEAAPAQKVAISSPEVDYNHKVIPMSLQPRAGCATYREELAERLKDLEDDTTGAYYQLPVKLPKAVYKRLLEGSLKLAEVTPDWTERDQIEALVIFSDPTLLTGATKKA